MVGRGVHRAGTVLGSDVLAEDHRHLALVERMAQLAAFQRRAGRMAEHGGRLQAVALRRLLGQGAGDHQQHAPAVARRAFDQRVFQLGAQRHRLAFRQRPRRGGPDRHGDDGVARIHAEHRGQRLRIDRVVGHVHRRRDLVGVLDLGLGQRRAAVEAPVHRLGAAHHMAVGDDPRQRADHVGLVGEIHRAIRLLPVAEHAQALEVAALAHRPARRRTRGTSGGRRAASSLSPGLPNFFSTAISIGRPWQSQPGTYGARWPASSFDLTVMSLRILLTAWPMWIEPLAYGGPSCSTNTLSRPAVLRLDLRVAVDRLPLGQPASARAWAGRRASGNPSAAG